MASADQQCINIQIQDKMKYDIRIENVKLKRYFTFFLEAMIMKLSNIPAAGNSIQRAIKMMF
jgi:hypothetical protein